MQKAAYSNSGLAYIGRGLELIRTKGLRRYVVVPILTNLILFSLAFTWLYGEVDYWLNRFMSWLPDFFQWLEFILWPLAVITIIALFSFIFSTIMHLIAAPFNGLLAEKVERYESGELRRRGFPWAYLKIFRVRLNVKCKNLCTTFRGRSVSFYYHSLFRLLGKLFGMSLFAG